MNKRCSKEILAVICFSFPFQSLSRQGNLQPIRAQKKYSEEERQQHQGIYRCYRVQYTNCGSVKIRQTKMFWEVDLDGCTLFVRTRGFPRLVYFFHKMYNCNLISYHIFLHHPLYVILSENSESRELVFVYY